MNLLNTVQMNNPLITTQTELMTRIIKVNILTTVLVQLKTRILNMYIVFKKKENMKNTHITLNLPDTVQI